MSRHRETFLNWVTVARCRDCADTEPGASKGNALAHAREFPGHRVVFTEVRSTEHVFQQLHDLRDPVECAHGHSMSEPCGFCVRL